MDSKIPCLAVGLISQLETAAERERERFCRDRMQMKEGRREGERRWQHNLKRLCSPSPLSRGGRDCCILGRAAIRQIYE
jgi:hypothetical protein